MEGAVHRMVFTSRMKTSFNVMVSSIYIHHHQSTSNNQFHDDSWLPTWSTSAKDNDAWLIPTLLVNKQTNIWKGGMNVYACVWVNNLLRTAEWPRRGAGILPPAVILDHCPAAVSKSKMEFIEIGLSVCMPWGSVTLRVNTTPPMIRIWPLGIMVAVWSTRGGGGSCTMG